MPSFDTEVSITEDVEIEFEVYCNKCGNGLCNETSTADATNSYSNKRLPTVNVNPCPNCMNEKYDEGYERGHEDCLKDIEKEKEK